MLISTTKIIHMYNSLNISPFYSKFSFFHITPNISGRGCFKSVPGRSAWCHQMKLLFVL